MHALVGELVILYNDLSGGFIIGLEVKCLQKAVVWNWAHMNFSLLSIDLFQWKPNYRAVIIIILGYYGVKRDKGIEWRHAIIWLYIMIREQYQKKLFLMTSPDQHSAKLWR